MINIIDVVIILLVLLGTIYGLKKGAIYMIVSLISVILIFYLSYYFKKPLSTLLYLNLPYFKYNGLSSFSVLIYDAFSFLILLILFTIIFKIIIKISDILSKIINNSIILTLPSKIVGAIIGFAEAYILILSALFILSTFSINNKILENSKFTNIILTKTPFTTNIKNTYNAVEKIKKIDDKKGVKEKNTEVINIILKYKLIDKKDMIKIIDNGKIEVDTKNIES